MRTADKRPSVLVTEDEAMISLDLCGALQNAGYHVIGPANTLQGALYLLEQQRPQVAIVDFLLRDECCALLVHQLHRRGVPFLVHSGYSKKDDLIALCHGAPWISKPSSPDHLIRKLAELHQHAVPA